METCPKDSLELLVGPEDEKTQKVPSSVLTKPEVGLLMTMRSFLVFFSVALAGYYYNLYTTAKHNPVTIVNNVDINDGDFPNITWTMVPLIAPHLVSQCPDWNCAKIAWAFHRNDEVWIMNVWNTPKRTESNTAFYVEMVMPFKIVFENGRQSIRHDLLLPCYDIPSRIQNGCERCFQIFPLIGGSVGNYVTCPTDMTSLPSLGIVGDSTPQLHGWMPSCTSAGASVRVKGVFMIPDHGPQVQNDIDSCTRLAYDPGSCLLATFPGGQTVDLQDTQNIHALIHKGTNVTQPDEPHPKTLLALDRVLIPKAAGLVYPDGYFADNNPGLISIIASPSLTVISQTVTQTAVQALSSWVTMSHAAYGAVMMFWTTVPTIPMHFKYGAEHQRYQERLYRVVHH